MKIFWMRDGRCNYNMGNRIRKQTNDPNAAAKIFIVDIAGELPTILCEIDPNDCSLKNSYFYGSNAQVLCQLAHGVDPNTLEATVDKYFYLHDRLGSVRLMINENAEVVNSYTYDPYGNAFAAETTENAYNPFRFTGQWYDAEIDQYYLRARQYDPQLMRFTTRDPVRGKFKQPLTVHRYLYCINDPVNRIDPNGKFSFSSIGQNLLFRSMMSGIGSGVFSGVRSKAMGGDFWAAAGGGFAGGFAGGMSASLSASGYIAAAISGGVSGGTSSALQGNDTQRVFVDVIAGGLIGYGMGKFIDGTVNIGMDSRGVPWVIQDFLNQDVSDIANPIIGNIGSDIWSIIGGWIF